MEYYHVITQSHYGKIIFPTEEDCVAYLQLVKEACEKYKIHWLAYAVMPTHTHLIFAIEEGGPARLTNARHKIACGYTAYARKAHPELCYKDTNIFMRKNKVNFLQSAYDVKKCIRYLHLNPLQKELENMPGKTIRSSYLAVLSLWEPENSENPFVYYFDLQEIRSALALELIGRFFGRNRNEQRQEFLSYHTGSLEESPSSAEPKKQQVPPQKQEEFKKAEQIVEKYFSQTHFRGKTFDTGNRQAFLHWLNRRGNTHKTILVLRLVGSTTLSTSEVAKLLNTSNTTVKRIVKKIK